MRCQINKSVLERDETRGVERCKGEDLGGKIGQEVIELMDGRERKVDYDFRAAGTSGVKV